MVPIPIDADGLSRLLDDASGRRVLVVGDVMLDRYVSGTVRRVSPEAPVPIVRTGSETESLGGAANVAACVTALGIPCDLVGLVGRDTAAGRLRTLAASTGLDPNGLVEDPSRPTTCKTRVVARHQQILRLDRESTDAPTEATGSSLAEKAFRLLEGSAALVLEDYDKGVFGGSLGPELIAAASEKGIPTIVDPKLRNFFALRGAHVFKPNGRELAAALGREDPPRDQDTLAGVRERLDCRYLLVTLGEDGMVLCSEGEADVAPIPSRAHEVFDVTGAGDTVTAVLGALLASGASVAVGAGVANLAAGIVVSRLGAVPVGRPELLQELTESRR